MSRITKTDPFALYSEKEGVTIKKVHVMKISKKKEFCHNCNEEKERVATLMVASHPLMICEDCVRDFLTIWEK
jgi:late competence protein required for DNA uptake (superfamily II DNA/RNA helicase)